MQAQTMKKQKKKKKKEKEIKNLFFWKNERNKRKIMQNNLNMWLIGSLRAFLVRVLEWIFQIFPKWIGLWFAQLHNNN